MTSVKEFRVERAPTDDALGRGTFVFTDDYSVFDWGPMPDEIPDKGASLCTMGAYNFERLEAEGVDTHYEGVVIDSDWDPEDGPPLAPVELAGAIDAPTEMAIALTNVPDLPHDGDDYDYDAYHEAAGTHYLVPLEVVYRNRVGVGSSLRRRTDPADHGLDLEEWPDDPVDLPEPVVEFSTKYEEQDRYLTRKEADRIAGAADVDALADLAREVNRVVTEEAEEADLVHEDGKIECCYRDGDLLVADVVGTFDENRFSFDGQQVSKEVLRQYHKATQSEWVDAVADAKATADERGVADWKSFCDHAPRPLDADVVEVARDLYAAGTNAYTGEDWFRAPSIEEAVINVRAL